jgi:hypothetical protein
MGLSSGVRRQLNNRMAAQTNKTERRGGGKERLVSAGVSGKVIVET